MPFKTVAQDSPLLVLPSFTLQQVDIKCGGISTAGMSFSAKGLNRIVNI